MRSRVASTAARFGRGPVLALAVAATTSLAVAVGGGASPAVAGPAAMPGAAARATLEAWTASGPIGAPSRGRPAGLLGNAGPSGIPSLTTAVLPAIACAGGWLPAPAGASWATAPGAAATAPSDYYAIELVPTGRVPGTRLAKGVAYTTAAASPFFGVSVAPGGEYVHDLDIRVEGLKPLDEGAYVAWVTDTEISQVVRVGSLDGNFRARGQARWNKFLLVLTREPAGGPTDAWQGPVIMRGMSRSGRMHTLAGHGPFEAEPCAKYGFR